MMSEDTRKNLSVINSGMGNPMFGRKISDEHRNKLRLAGLKQVPWNKGLTKNSDDRLKYVSKLMTGRHQSEESNNKNRLAHMRKVESVETRAKISVKCRIKWYDLDYARKCINIKDCPNLAEKKLMNILNELFPDEYKFVGDNQVRIESFNPDFININGQKKIIELFGEQWHSSEYRKLLDARRLQTYQLYGYSTLIVWSKQLYRNIEDLKRILLTFHKDGGVPSV